MSFFSSGLAVNALGTDYKPLKSQIDGPTNQNQSQAVLFDVVAVEQRTLQRGPTFGKAMEIRMVI